jgi:outer membrane protein assembly factor BamE (lipoprotein component of BamABCDE complex)
MILRQARGFALALTGAGLLLGGCTKISDRQGFVMDETLLSAIQPGVDNRDSVQNTLGRPTFTGQFSDNDWYYVTRETRNLAFNMPHPKSQIIVRVRFDPAGNVTAIDRRGMEQVAMIHPDKSKTPTLGRDRSLLEQLFGNIGTVGSTGQGGNTADNPNQ